MPVVPGEYEFDCGECEGEGSIEVIVSASRTEWRRCEDCHGEGVLSVDEEEAAEMIEWGGASPRSAPAGFSED